MKKGQTWWAERTESLGSAIDAIRELQTTLDGFPVDATDALAEALATLGRAQQALTYELGVAARAEYAKRPLDGSMSGRGV